MVEEVTDQRATEVVNFATEVYLTGVCSKPCAFMIAIATFAKLPSLLKVFSALALFASGNSWQIRNVIEMRTTDQKPGEKIWFSAGCSVLTRSGQVNIFFGLKYN